MPVKAKYLYIASMDVDPAKEAIFNEVYDTEHIPNLMKVPGVHAAYRAKSESFSSVMGGKTTEYPPASPVYSAFYEIDGPHVLTSPEWAKAVDSGRWPKEVRPFCSNRRYTMHKLR